MRYNSFTIESLIKVEIHWDMESYFTTELLMNNKRTCNKMFIKVYKKKKTQKSVSYLSIFK